jgi:hypothetical protein
MPCAIGQHHGLAAALVGLEQAHHEIEPVVVLDPWIHAARWNALRRADDQVDAALLLVGVGDPDERDGECHEAVRAGARITRTRRGPAACAQQLDIRVAQAGAAHALVHHLAHAVAADTRIEPQRRAAGFEAVEVVAQPEELALPHMRHVVRGVRMQEAPVEDGDLRVFGSDELAVDIGATVHARIVAAMR